MPELPEVQTIVDDLSRKIKGDTVVSFWSDWPKAINQSIKKTQESVRNRIIESIDRRGKFIILSLSGGLKIIMHLRMTGHLLVKSQLQNLKYKINCKSKNNKQKEINYFDDKVNQYIHHIFYLKSGRTLEFSDARKFGTIRLVQGGAPESQSSLRNLGVDALGKKFTSQKLRQLLNRKTAKIKSLLLDQSQLAGIGNIYASEILFEAKINPEKAGKDLSGKEMSDLHRAIKKILKQAIKLRGTSDSDYRDTSGAPGHFQKVLKVYRRTGKNCPRCATIIQRKTIGQRGTFFCPRCQK